MWQRFKIIGLVLFVMIISIACNLPSMTAPTPFKSPTPNITLTAISNVLSTLTAPTLVIPTSTNTQQIISTSPSLPTATQVPASSTNTTMPPTNTSIPPTDTQAPTSTPVSYVGPAIRNGPSIKAYYLQSEPSIDGVFDDWNLDRYSVANVVYGNAEWEDNDDLSAKVMIGWDDSFMYIAGRVIDDVFVQNAFGEELFKGDSIEILLDKRVSNDFYLDKLSDDDFQVGISPGSLSVDSEAYVWYPLSEKGSQTGIKIGVTSTSNGYRIEVKVPWSVFSISPDIGQHYGFAFSVSDNDRADRNIQQSMVSNVANRILTDPTRWGDIVLMGQFK